MASAQRAKGRLGSRLARPFVNLYQFLQGVWFELHRVVWPSKEETWTFTVVTVIAVLAVATYMGLLDWVLVLFTRGVLGLY